MASNTFYANGATGNLVICDYGYHTLADSNPNSYLSHIHFHSALPYLQFKDSLTAINVTSPILNRDTYDTGGGGCCYITTACVTYKGKQDDCEELQVLRKFRDEYMLKYKEGAKLVQLYYDTAPEYVTYLDSMHNKDVVYDLIYNKYIIPAVELIKNKQYQEAQNVYTLMYLYVKNLVGDNIVNNILTN